MSSFTLPTNGKDFTAQVQIGFQATMLNIDTNEPLDVSGSAVGKMTFHFSNGFYYADRAGFITTPEPGTLALMGTGLISIIALARKRISI